MGRIRSRVLLGILCLLGWAGALAVAPRFARAWSSDPTVNDPVIVAPNTQNNPRMTSDGAGGAIIVWEQGGGAGLRAQRLDSSGAPLWDPAGEVVTGDFSSETYNPEMIGDGAGGAIVVWHGDNTPNSYEIFAQRLDPSGSALWGASGVQLTTATAAQVNPHLTSDGAGGAIIAWEDYRNADSFFDPTIFAQRIDSSGSDLWAAGGVQICNPGVPLSQQQWPRLVSDGAGGAIISFEESRTGSNAGIYVQRVNSLGAPQWGAGGTTLAQNPNLADTPEICSDGAGGAIVAWMDGRTPGNINVYARRVNSSGAAQWAANGVAITSVAGDEYFPKIIADGAGGGILAWYDGAGLDPDLFAQRIDGSGAALWGGGGLPLTDALGAGSTREMIADGSGGAIFAWYDLRTTTGFDVYAQHVNGAGAPLWTVDGVAICTVAQRTFTMHDGPQIVSDGLGGAIMVWEDYRSSPTYDIYAARVSPSGLLGDGLAVRAWRGYP